MSASASVYSEPLRTPVHIPKLKYRQSSYDVPSATETTNFSSSQPTIPTILTPSSQSEFCPSPLYPPSDISQGSDSRRTSLAPSTLAPPRTPDKAGKKKKNFLSSLFSVKEPSAQALADFEKQLKSQGTLKNGRVTAVGMPGVSTAKLPADVPKVNSKWDGSPRTARKTEKKECRPSLIQLRSLNGSSNSTSDQSASSSSGSLRTAARRPNSRGTIGGASVYTTHSDGTRNQLADLYGWEIADYSGELAGNTSRPSTKGLSVRSMPSYTSQGVAVEPTEPPKIPEAYIEPAQANKPLSPNPPAHSHSPTLTPRDESPATPIGQSPLTNVESIKSENNFSKEQDNTEGIIRTTVIEAPNDEVIIKSSGVNILSPPLTARRKPKTPSTKLESDEQGDKTLKEPKSILKKESVSSLSKLSPSRTHLDPLYTQTAVLDYYHGPQWKKKMGVSKIPGRETDGEDDKRSNSPTPDNGTLLQRRRSIAGIFKRT